MVGSGKKYNDRQTAVKGQQAMGREEDGSWMFISNSQGKSLRKKWRPGHS